jgi:hypothetical protein
MRWKPRLAGKPFPQTDEASGVTGQAYRSGCMREFSLKWQLAPMLT